MTTRCLVGCSGVIGKNLRNQLKFDDLYNSTNITDLANKTYNEVYLACLPATKWLINNNPVQDYANVMTIINILDTVSCDMCVLISTIDVYPNRNEHFDESSNIQWNEHITCYYGYHRYIFEQYISSRFSNHIIVRLPGIYGKYIKKNVIYDMINNNNIDCINIHSSLQWYFIDDLYNDISYYIYKKYKVINLFTEPVSNQTICTKFFPHIINKMVCSTNNIITYDMCTNSHEKKYIYDSDMVLHKMSAYLKNIHKAYNNKYIFTNISWNSDESSYIFNMFAEHNINNIEIALTKYAPWDMLSDDYIQHIHQTFNEKKINIYSLQAILYGLNYNIFSSDNVEMISHIERVIRYANMLGCTLIVFGSPKNRLIPNNMSYNDAYEMACVFFKKINDIAKSHDIIVCIEPNSKQYGCNFLHNMEQTYAFVKYINTTNVKMMVDIGNILMENENIHDILKYIDEIKHIHLSNVYLSSINNDNMKHNIISNIINKIDVDHITIEMNSCSNNIHNIYQTINLIYNEYN
jgi:sugar phosphate isomerase/epimerase